MSIPKLVGSEQIVYKGKTIEVVHQVLDFNGVQRTREFARRCPGTRLIIIRADEVLLTKEYRHELKGWDYRLPGGKVTDSLSEYHTLLKSSQDFMSAITEAAKKEAREECGLLVNSLSHFSTSVAGATVTWDLYYFIVSDFTEAPNQELELGENIETKWFSLAQAKELALSNQMSEDRSSAVLLRYLYSLGKL